MATANSLSQQQAQKPALTILQQESTQNNTQQGKKKTQLTSFPISNSPSSSTAATARVTTSRTILRNAAFKFGASAARSRTNRPSSPALSTPSCENSRSCDAMFGPVTISAAGILSPGGGAAAVSRTNAATAVSVARLDSLRTFWGGALAIG